MVNDLPTCCLVLCTHSAIVLLYHILRYSILIKTSCQTYLSFSENQGTKQNRPSLSWKQPSFCLTLDKRIRDNICIENLLYPFNFDVPSPCKQQVSCLHFYIWDSRTTARYQKLLWLCRILIETGWVPTYSRHNALGHP